jgi:hypothetical protein
LRLFSAPPAFLPTLIAVLPHFRRSAKTHCPGALQHSGSTPTSEFNALLLAAKYKIPEAKLPDTNRR